MTVERESAVAGDLARFVEEALVQVIEGIASAQLRVDELGAQINPIGILPADERRKTMLINPKRLAYLETVDFDVAVTRSEEQSGGAAGEIRVMGIGVGGKAATTDETTRVSRIKFAVTVFPGDPNPESDAAISERNKQIAKSQRRGVINRGIVR